MGGWQFTFISCQESMHKVSRKTSDAPVSVYVPSANPARTSPQSFAAVANLCSGANLRRSTLPKNQPVRFNLQCINGYHSEALLQGNGTLLLSQNSLVDCFSLRPCTGTVAADRWHVVPLMFWQALRKLSNTRSYEVCWLAVIQRKEALHKVIVS